MSLFAATVTDLLPSFPSRRLLVATPAGPTWTVSVRERGQGPVVVLVHGLGSSSTQWLPVMKALGAGRRLVAVDLPGFGESPLGRPSVAVADLAEVVAAMPAALNARPHLVGHSLGGAVALAAWWRAPHGFASLALLAPAGRPDPGLHLSPLLAAATRLSLARPLVARWYVSPRHMRSIARGLVGEPWRLCPVDLDGVRQSFRLCSFLTQLRGPKPVDLPGFDHRWPRTPGPVRLLWGSRDEVVPVAAAAAWQAARPGTHLGQVAGAGHLLPLEQPVLVASWLARFWQQVEHLARAFPF